MKRRTFIATLGAAAVALFTGKPTKALALMEGPPDIRAIIRELGRHRVKFPTAANLNRNWPNRYPVTGTYIGIGKEQHILSGVPIDFKTLTIRQIDADTQT